MSQISVAAFVNQHLNIVLEIREEDKILAWCGFTAAQAVNLAATLTSLAALITKSETQDVEDANPRSN